MESHLLRNIYLFQDFSDAELKRLESLAELKSYAAGEQLFEEGDPALSLLVIKYGSVQISQAGEDNTVMLATLGTGSHFGEMSFLDGEPRSATARAMEQSEIVVIAYDALRRLLDGDAALAAKFYRSLAQFLGGRLRVTSGDLRFARSRKR
ncbi:MAG: cyclic nucleotide-binding domain-containing protein [Pseudomonadota bacterium]|jgi:CRP-like cAMP-binding protein